MCNVIGGEIDSISGNTVNIKDQDSKLWSFEVYSTAGLSTGDDIVCGLKSVYNGYQASFVVPLSQVTWHYADGNNPGNPPPTSPF